MQRYFFLYHPYPVEKEVIKKGKKTTETIYKRNCETRDKFVESKGIEAFNKICEKDKNWERLKDPEIPITFRWIWKHFFFIWQNCKRDVMGNVELTFETINQYTECMKVPLSIMDKKIILKMKSWAVNQITEMKE